MKAILTLVLIVSHAYAFLDEKALTTLQTLGEVDFHVRLELRYNLMSIVQIIGTLFVSFYRTRRPSASTWRAI